MNEKTQTKDTYSVLNSSEHTKSVPPTNHFPLYNFLGELSAISNDNRLCGLSRLGTNGFNSFDNFHTFGDISEDAVFTIQPSSFDSAQKELRSVGVGTSVGHGQNTGTSVFQ